MDKAVKAMSPVSTDKSKTESVSAFIINDSSLKDIQQQLAQHDKDMKAFNTRLEEFSKVVNKQASPVPNSEQNSKISNSNIDSNTTEINARIDKAFSVLNFLLSKNKVTYSSDDIVVLSAKYESLEEKLKLKIDIKEMDEVKELINTLQSIQQSAENNAMPSDSNLEMVPKILMQIEQVNKTITELESMYQTRFEDVFNSLQTISTKITVPRIKYSKRTTDNEVSPIDEVNAETGKLKILVTNAVTNMKEADRMGVIKGIFSSKQNSPSNHASQSNKRVSPSSHAYYLDALATNDYKSSFLKNGFQSRQRGSTRNDYYLDRVKKLTFFK